MIALLLNFIGLCFSIFIIVIVILTWTNTNKLVHSEPFLAGEGFIPRDQCTMAKNALACNKMNKGRGQRDICQWFKPGGDTGGVGICVPVPQ